jgi:hypothetical protein
LDFLFDFIFIISSIQDSPSPADPDLSPIPILNMYTFLLQRQGLSKVLFFNVNIRGLVWEKNRMEWTDTRYR